jgi:hypothetical protein
MGTITFEGEPPYEQLSAISATSEPTRDGVLLTLNVALEGPEGETIPVQILLEPEVAVALGSLLPIHAAVVERWRSNQS